MDSLPVDPTLAIREANRDDLIQRKLSIDALRQRLGDTATKQEKLRESCEGFEAIFLQKMWEQMRKTVPKEGYLHSKDEEAYQSMFDIELCKKMAGAGGIGLADMLYAQLSQQLENTGRTTTPGSYRNFLPIPPSDTLMPGGPETAATASSAPSAPSTGVALTAEHLYSPLDTPMNAAQVPADVPAKPTPAATIMGAIDELKTELGLQPRAGDGAAVKEWAAAREAMVNPMAPEVAAVAGQGQAPAQAGPAATGAASARQASGPGAASLATGNLFGRDKNAAQAKLAETQSKPPVQPRGMAPRDTLWPVPAEQGSVVSRFGWEDDPATGKRRWNSGVRIAAAPDTPVRAVLPGTVVYAGDREGFGHTVVIEHKDGYRSYYSNLAENSIKIGDQIRHGAEFAQIAAQPPSSANGEKAASLHFELKKGEMALNPESAIQHEPSVS